MKKNKITQINCHTEFSSASHKILKQAVRCAHPLRDRLSASPTAQDDRNNESGRSMVEMLGVLAIIGVLSVGGIAGYTSAMNKHRANETIDRLMKRAIIVSGQRLLGQEGSLSGFNENDGTYAITLNDGASGTATTFTMTATNVPQVVCEKIKALDWKLPVISPDTCGETNNMTFTFNNDLSEKSTSNNQESTNPCAGKSDYTSCEDDKICFSERCQVDCRGPNHTTDINANYYYPNCPEHCILMEGGFFGCHNSEAEARLRCGLLPWERIDDKHFICD